MEHAHEDTGQQELAELSRAALPTKQSFVGSLPSDMPIDEVSRRAALAGLDVPADQVSKLRWNARRAAVAGKTRQKVLGTRPGPAKRSYHRPSAAERAERDAWIAAQERGLTWQQIARLAKREKGWKLTEGVIATRRAKLGIGPGRGRPKVVPAAASQPPVRAAKKAVSAPPPADGPRDENEQTFVRLAFDIGIPRAAALVSLLHATMMGSVDNLLGGKR